MKKFKFNALCFLITLMLTSQVFAELTYSVQRRVDIVSSKLEQVELLLQKDIAQAKITMAEAQQEFDYIGQYYKGKFDENNDQIVRLRSVLNELNTQFISLNKTSQVAPKKEQLNLSGSNHKLHPRIRSLLQVLDDYDQKYLAQYNQLQKDLLKLSSQLQTNDYQKINEATIGLADSLSLFNTTFYPLSKLLTSLKNKQPGWQDLMNQGADGTEVSLLIRNLSAEVSSWEKQRSKLVNLWLEEAEAAITHTEMVMAQVQQMPVNAQEPMVNQFIDLLKTPKLLVSVVPALFPKQKSASDIAHYLTRVITLNKGFNEIEVKVSAIAQSAQKAIADQIMNNRFPSNLNSEHADKALILKAYEQAYKSPEILRFGVSKTWYEKTEAHWNNNVLEVGTYQYIHAWIAHETESGQIRAYNTTYRRVLNQDGSWSDTSYWGVGTSYEVLKQNINI